MNFRMLVQFNSSCHWNVIPSNKNRQQIPASTLDRGGEFCLSLSKNQGQGYKKKKLLFCTSKCQLQLLKDEHENQRDWLIG